MNDGTAGHPGRRSSRVWRRVRAGITITVGGLAAVAGVQLGLTAPLVSPVDPAATGTSTVAAAVPPATVPDLAPATRDRANDGNAGDRGRGALVRDDDAGQRGGRR
jgi:hypothetical protein